MAINSKKIFLSNWNLGGLSSSKYQGAENSAYKLVGLDLHSEPGVIKTHQKLTKESGTTIDDMVLKILPCSDGKTYAFGSTNGKIWERTSLGVWSLVATCGLASPGIFDAVEDQGYIYYMSAANVGRWQIGTAWSGKTDNWATFTEGNTSYHPIKKLNLIVYIGDGRYVAQIADGVFTGNALDIKSGYAICSLGQYDTKLLLGTIVNENINRTEILLWDTYSESFTSSDPIPELGVNAFFDTDNQILVNCGKKGNIYSYNGGILSEVNRIQGNWIVGNNAKVYNNAVTNYGGLPLFGVSNIANNPCLCGVYGLGGYSNSFPQVMSLDYVISQDKTSDISIGAMTIVNDTLLVSWQDGTTYGIDKLDSSNKYNNAYIETRVMQFPRELRMTIKEIYTLVRLLPANCQILMYASVNNGAYTALPILKDDGRGIFYATAELRDVYNLQLKIISQSYQNTAPEIEGIEITYE